MLPREHYLKQPFPGIHQLPATHPLSPAQVRLIKKHGTLIVALLNDEVVDPSLEDLRFLKVINHKSSPSNPLELAWLKYQSVLQNTALKQCS